MITIKNIRNLLGITETLAIASEIEKTIDADGLMLLPAVIDTGISSPADWNHFAQKAIEGGVTTLFYLSHYLQTLTQAEVLARNKQMDELLSLGKVSLHSQAYFELRPPALESLGKCKNQLAAVVVSKELHEEKVIDRIFQLAGQDDCIVAYVCDSNDLQKTRKMIDFTEKYSNQLLLMNITTEEELTYLREAKKSELLVFSSVSSAALQVNDLLWEAIYDKTIDLAASDAINPEPNCILSTLLDGYNSKKITLEGVVALTRSNAEKIFRLNYNSDITLVDLEKPKITGNGKILKGATCYTIINGYVFSS